MFKIRSNRELLNILNGKQRMVNCECYESFTLDAEQHEQNETNELIRMMEGKSTAATTITIATVMRRRWKKPIRTTTTTTTNIGRNHFLRATSHINRKDNAMTTSQQSERRKKRRKRKMLMAMIFNIQRQSKAKQSGKEQGTLLIRQFSPPYTQTHPAAYIEHIAHSAYIFS